MSRTMKTAKYPGWEIERLGDNGDAGYLMTRPDGIFAIGVGYSDEQGWEGMLLTRQRGSWAPAKTPYVHSVMGCIREIDRRERLIARQAARPLSKLTK